MIRETSLTIRLGVAGRVGTVIGWTTPSVTDVTVIGTSPQDRAFAVTLEGAIVSEWFVQEPVKRVDHGSGMVIQIGDRVIERNAIGEWIDGPQVNGEKK